MIYESKISPQNKTEAETTSGDVELKLSRPASPGRRLRRVRGYLMLDWPAAWKWARPITVLNRAAHVDLSDGSRVTSHYFLGWENGKATQEPRYLLRNRRTMA